MHGGAEAAGARARRCTARWMPRAAAVRPPAWMRSSPSSPARGCSSRVLPLLLQRSCCFADVTRTPSATRCDITCRLPLRRRRYLQVVLAELHARPTGLPCAQAGKGYAGPREALVLNGNFVLTQLRRMDAATAAGARLAESAFARALQQQARSCGHAWHCAWHKRAATHTQWHDLAPAIDCDVLEGLFGCCACAA